MAKHKNKSKLHKTSIGDILIAFILLLVAFASFVPFWHIVVCTFATPEDIASEMFLIIPKSFNLDTIKYIMSTDTFIGALFNSFYITIVGTAIAVALTAMMAYPLSRPNLRFRDPIMYMIVVTMVFNPGMIPNFLNVRNIGMYNSTWAVIIPTAIGAYNLILIKNFYQSLPDSLSESAKIDGANDFTIFLKIVFPLSKPIIATVSLFYAVGYWNAYLPSVLFLRDDTKWPIQVLLRNIVLLAQTDLGGDAVISSMIDLQALRSATIFVSTIPILCAYPFLQKYFTKGIMMGSVKG